MSTKKADAEKDSDSAEESDTESNDTDSNDNATHFAQGTKVLFKEGLDWLPGKVKFTYRAVGHADTMEDPVVDALGGPGRRYVVQQADTQKMIVMSSTGLREYDADLDCVLNRSQCAIWGCTHPRNRKAPLCSHHQKNWRNFGYPKLDQKARREKWLITQQPGGVMQNLVLLCSHCLARARAHT
jgi:hypothetical protein